MLDRNYQPRISVITDFISVEDFETLYTYCYENKDLFKEVNQTSSAWDNHNAWREDSNTRKAMSYIEQPHSKFKDITYMKAVPILEKYSGPDSYEEVQQKIPSDIIILTHYSIWPDSPMKEKAIDILKNVLEKTEQMIKDIYNVKALAESGPWISLAENGAHMNMHLDGYPSEDESKITEFSSVFYISDKNDFEGGILTCL